jgi:hypothetical protein
VLGDDRREAVGDEGERLVPGDRDVPAVALDERRAEPVRILVELLEGRALRTDEAVAEHVVTVAPYPHDAVILVGHLDTARRLAQRTGSVARLHPMSFSEVRRL